MVWLNISNENFLHQISHNPLLRFSGCFLSRYSTVYTLLERCTSTITDRTPRKSHDKTLKPFRISEGNDSDNPREPYCPCIKLTFLSLLIMYTFSMQKMNKNMYQQLSASVLLSRVKYLWFLYPFSFIQTEKGKMTNIVDFLSYLIYKKTLPKTQILKYHEMKTSHKEKYNYK